MYEGRAEEGPEVIAMKTCTKCQTEKSPESFYKDGAGLRAECKACTLVARAKFYAGNSREILSNGKTNYVKDGLKKRHAAERGEPGMPTHVCLDCEKNKPVSAFLKKSQFICRKCLGKTYVRDEKKRVASVRRYESTHRDQRAKAVRLARLADPLKFRNRDKARRPQTTIREREFYARPENRIARRAWVRADYIADPKKYIAWVAKRRARKLAAPGVCTAEQLKARFEIYGNCCAYCGAPAEASDHVIALNRGGSNWPANIRPSCKSCNSSKGDKPLAVWKAEKFAA